MIGIALHGNITNQFPDEVFAIESALASAIVDSYAADRRLYVLTRDNFPFFPVFGSGEFQNADFAAFFPFAIRWFADATNFSRNRVGTL